MMKSLEKYCFFWHQGGDDGNDFGEIKFRPVKSRMSAFVDRFSMTKSSSESAEMIRKPGIRLGLTIGDFIDDITKYSMRIVLNGVITIPNADGHHVGFWKNNHNFCPELRDLAQILV